MLLKRLATFFLFCLLSQLTFGQSDSDSSPTALDNKLVPLPTVSLNVGFNHLTSDVALSDAGPTPFKQLGYQLAITQRAAKFLNVSLELYTGIVYGEQMVNLTNLNFRTSLFSQRLSFEYNFYPLLKPDERGRQLIRPFVGFGVGMVSFRSKGDLKDENGVAYQYWSDGTINAELEGSIDPAEATRLERDFVYETDLRDANLDGLRKYPQLAFSMPFNAGIRFQVSKNVGVNAAFSYCMNFSDMLDNVSVDGVGDRQGSKGFDNNLFGSVGLSIFLGNVRPTVKAKQLPRETLSKKPNSKTDRNKQTENTTETSSDDLSEPTAKNDDQDVDSTNQSQIEQPVSTETSTDSSQSSKQSDDDAATSTPEKVADNTDETKEIRNELNSEKPSEASENKKPIDLTNIDLSNTKPKETSTFHWADLDGSGLISPDEVLHFIDLLFEGEGERSVEDIQNLIDYYFDQE